MTDIVNLVFHLLYSKYKTKIIFFVSLFLLQQKYKLRNPQKNKSIYIDYHAKCEYYLSQTIINCSIFCTVELLKSNFVIYQNIKHPILVPQKYWPYVVHIDLVNLHNERVKWFSIPVITSLKYNISLMRQQREIYFLNQSMSASNLVEPQDRNYLVTEFAIGHYKLQMSLRPGVNSILQNIARQPPPVFHSPSTKLQVSSDSVTRHPQIFRFIGGTMEQPVIRRLTIKDVLEGEASLPYTNRSVSYSTQADCPHIHILGTQGTRLSTM